MRETTNDKILKFIFYLMIILFALLCLYPFILLLTNSFSDELELLRHGYRLFPKKFSLEAYRIIFADSAIYSAYGITIFTTVVGTLLNLVVTSMLAYALSCRDLKYRNAIAMYMYFTMLFSGGLVSSYLLISKYLGLKNTIWVYLLPNLVSAWNTLIMRNFFKDIPESLRESAKIDGASEARILYQIVLPISLPAIATIGLFYALVHWNEWFMAIMYIEDPNLYTLQYIIMKVMRNMNYASQISQESGISVNGMIPAYTAQLATTVVTIGPIIFLYPYLQKYFVKGLTVGSVKG